MSGLEFKDFMYTIMSKGLETIDMKCQIRMRCLPSLLAVCAVFVLGCDTSKNPPQVSDAARVGAPGSTVDQVCSIVAEQMGVSRPQISPQTSLGDLKADELDFVELVMELEEHFDVSISDATAEKMMGTNNWQQGMKNVTMAKLAAVVDELKQMKPHGHVSGQSTRITLLGDRTRHELALQLKGIFHDANTKNTFRQFSVTATIDRRCVEVTAVKSDNVAEQAPSCSVADGVAIVMDARDGPMPIHREHIVFARQMTVPTILVVFTHTDAIDDPELLELEELEMRDLLNEYGWQGDAALVVYDSERASVGDRVGVPLGLRAFGQYLARLPSRPAAPQGVMTAGCSAGIYTLSMEEAYPLKTTGLAPGKYTVLLGDSTFDVQVHSEGRIRPKQNSTVRLDFGRPIYLYLGQRFVILIDNHITAVGFVADTKP
ncbi:MAG: hypothetical protein JW818_07835 [Pirellulales bacterium]|nr:hypothetical protein [Pirellulales bacterium]